MKNVGVVGRGGGRVEKRKESHLQRLNSTVQVFDNDGENNTHTDKGDNTTTDDFVFVALIRMEYTHD